MSNDGAREASEALVEASAVDDVRVAGDAADAGADAPSQTTPCGTVCVPPATSPWTGPYEIFEGTGAPPPTLPSCAGAFPIDVYDGLGSPNAPPASCTCTCGSLTGASCSSPVATFFADSACTLSCGAQTAITASCTLLSNCSFWVLGSSTPQGGSCTPSASKTVTPAKWTANGRLCGAASPPVASGCSGGMVCVAQGAINARGYCVARAGAGFSCPAGYPVMKTYFGASSDTRDCATCSCGAATGVACDGSASVTGYMDLACSKKTTAESAPTSCSSVSHQSAQFSGVTPTGGMCASRGGQPTGTFTPTTQTTICCTP
jgi:hypothetical protein